MPAAVSSAKRSSINRYSSHFQISGRTDQGFDHFGRILIKPLQNINNIRGICASCLGIQILKRHQNICAIAAARYEFSHLKRDLRRTQLLGQVLTGCTKPLLQACQHRIRAQG